MKKEGSKKKRGLEKKREDICMRFSRHGKCSGLCYDTS